VNLDTRFVKFRINYINYRAHTWKNREH